jgi:hypothetical protein
MRELKKGGGENLLVSGGGVGGQLVQVLIGLYSR